MEHTSHSTGQGCCSSCVSLEQLWLQHRPSLAEPQQQQLSRSDPGQHGGFDVLTEGSDAEKSDLDHFDAWGLESLIFLVGFLGTSDAESCELAKVMSVFVSKRVWVTKRVWNFEGVSSLLSSTQEGEYLYLLNHVRSFLPAISWQNPAASPGLFPRNDQQRNE